MDKLDTSMEQQFDLNLIEAVKMNPVIYDRSHYNYKHFVRKAQTWKQIAESLGVPEQKCTKRWKSLRDKFAREMKLSQGSRWRYFKQMQFLVDSIRQYRESLLGKCNNVQNASQVAQVDPNQQQQQPQQAVVDIFAQPFNGNASTSAQAISAEDQSFGMVVTDMLNTLGVRQKAEAKVHIIKYLTDMQLLAQHNKY